MQHVTQGRNFCAFWAISAYFERLGWHFGHKSQIPVKRALMHDNFRNEGSDDVFRDISVIRRIDALHQKEFKDRDPLVKVAWLRLFLLLRFELRKLVFYRFQQYNVLLQGVPLFSLHKRYSVVDYTFGTRYP